MSLRKAIESGAEYRKEYHDSRAIDGTCRNNKGCPWCEANRTHQQKVLMEKARQELEELKEKEV